VTINIYRCTDLVVDNTNQRRMAAWPIRFLTGARPGKRLHTPEFNGEDTKRNMLQKNKILYKWKMSLAVYFQVCCWCSSFTLRPKKKDCWFPLTLSGQFYPAWSINFIGIFIRNKYFWSQPCHFFQHELEILIFFSLFSMDTRIKLSYLPSKEE
jgi:hypothetical protein